MRGSLNVYNVYEYLIEKLRGRKFIFVKQSLIDIIKKGEIVGFYKSNNHNFDDINKGLVLLMSFTCLSLSAASLIISKQETKSKMQRFKEVKHVFIVNSNL
jgi:hypothetical protein